MTEPVAQPTDDAVGGLIAILATDLAQRDRALAARQMTRQEYRQAARTDVATIARFLDLMRPSDADRRRLTDFIAAKLADWAWSSRRGAASPAKRKGKV